jgi:hypothetical protein
MFSDKNCYFYPGLIPFGFNDMEKNNKKNKESTLAIAINSVLVTTNIVIIASSIHKFIYK